MTQAEYTVLLARVLQTEKIGAPLHSLMTLLAIAKVKGEKLDITRASHRLGCGYNAIAHHLFNVRPGSTGNRREAGKHAHLFVVDRSVAPFLISLSDEGEHLLGRINALMKTHVASESKTAAVRQNESSKPKRMKELNDRQRRFAEFVAAGDPCTVAYEKAGYEGGENAKANASRMMENDGVKAYLEELRKPQAEAAVLTRQKKREILFEIATAAQAKAADRTRAITVDNLMTGDHMPQKFDVTLDEQLRKLFGPIENPPALPDDRDEI